MLAGQRWLLGPDSAGMGLCPGRLCTTEAPLAASAVSEDGSIQPVLPAQRWQTAKPTKCSSQRRHKGTVKVTPKIIKHPICWDWTSSRQVTLPRQGNKEQDPNNQGPSSIYKLDSEATHGFITFLSDCLILPVSLTHQADPDPAAKQEHNEVG